MQYLKTRNECQDNELRGNCTRIGACRNEDDHDDPWMVRRWWSDALALYRTNREREDTARTFGMLNATP